MPRLSTKICSTVVAVSRTLLICKVQGRVPAVNVQALITYESHLVVFPHRLAGTTIASYSKSVLANPDHAPPLPASCMLPTEAYHIRTRCA